MTSQTGSTASLLPTSFIPPTFALTTVGYVAQLGTFAYVWSTNTDTLRCLAAPRECWRDDGEGAFFWGKSVLATIGVAITTWLISVTLGFLHKGATTSDPSLVDRLWSTLPILHLWWFWSRSAAPSPRLFLMALLVTAWGGRLTWNFWRKGGFSGGEDYRWAVIRKWYRGWRFEVFNLCFIVFYQLFLITAFAGGPAAIVLRQEASGGTAKSATAELNALDLVALALGAALVLGETVADNQMWAFQTEKYRRKDAKEALDGVYAAGFLQTGLYGVSRHPNYFCEVSLWWVFYLFSVAAGAPWMNWAIAGPVLLTALFVAPRASIDLAEALSSSKYPGYTQYIQRVPKCIPFLRCGGSGAAKKSEE